MIFGVAGQANAQDVTPSALSETYGDWIVQCVNAAAPKQQEQEPATKRICQVSQSLAQGNSNQRILMIVFEDTAKDKQPLAGTVIAPFGIDLQSGLALRIKDDVYAKAAYKTCLPQGCVAPVAVDAKFEAALRANEKLTVAMTASDTGAPVTLDVSLKGLAQSLDRLKKLAAAGG
ncbi:invasion protein IalB [Aminobacter sp. AP02]|nr:invasion protein IalB [Aminobacter sp. AP02]